MIYTYRLGSRAICVSYEPRTKNVARFRSNRCEGKVLSDFSLKTVVLGHGRRSPDKEPSVLFGRTNRSNFCCTSPVMVTSPYEY